MPGDGVRNDSCLVALCVGTRTSAASMWSSRLVAFAAIVGCTLALDAGGRAEPALVPPPLIGANYSHYANQNCSLDDTGIVTHYHERGVRRRVQSQLVAMRTAGIETLRLLLWHMTDASEQRWGVVSAAGRLDDPYRSNLIRYLRDVRSAGFELLTVSFGPMWTNSPFGQPDYVYDRTKFDENWAVIQDVRSLVKTHGPPSRIDLINEAPPSEYYTPLEQIAGLRQYIAELYTRYVMTYGNDDVLVSAIAKGDPSRLAQLIDILKGTGQPLPRWLEIHPSFSGGDALRDLRAADATLAANGLSQPFIIGEEAYDDRPVAQAIADFMSTSARPVTEVLEWPLTADIPCKDMSVSAPYRADEYITVLTGKPAPPPTPSPLPALPIPTIKASVGPARSISLRTETGRSVTTLNSGPYRIVVQDTSTKDNFHLAGPGIDRRTGLRFRGTVVWRVELGNSAAYGSRYSYASDRKRAGLRGSFRIS